MHMCVYLMCYLYAPVHVDAACVQVGLPRTIFGSHSFSVCLLCGEPGQYVLDAERCVDPGAVSGYRNEAPCQRYWSGNIQL